MPPSILVVLVVVIGLAPFLAEPFVKLVTASVLGDTAEVPKAHFKIWHGLTPALYMSIIATVGGLLVLAAFKPLLKAWDATPRPEAKVIFEAVIRIAVSAARGLILPLHNGAFTRYAAIGSVVIIAVGAYAWQTGTVGAPTRTVQAAGAVPIAGWVMLVAGDCRFDVPAPEPSFLAHVDRDRWLDGFDRLHFLQCTRPGDDTIHGRSGYHHPASSGPQLPAKADPRRKHGPAPRPGCWHRNCGRAGDVHAVVPLHVAGFRGDADFRIPSGELLQGRRGYERGQRDPRGFPRI